VLSPRVVSPAAPAPQQMHPGYYEKKPRARKRKNSSSNNEDETEPPPASVPPPSLNGQNLYEREDACQTLFHLLQNTLGTRITPFCDNCYGAGKTSLIWKFRNVLNGIQGWEWPQGSQPLRDAIYVHVQFVDSLTPNHPLNFENPDEIDRMLLQRFTEIFSISLRNFDLVPASFDELIRIVNDRCGEYKLLVHMDDIGAYEHCEHAKNILYRMWHIGEKFRLNGGHFYVLTGRSSHLHTIGKSPSKAKPSCFESPNPGELIPLPLLTTNSIKLILQEHAGKLSLDLFNENNEPKEEIINHIYSFTSGVPRAVNAALLCYLQTNNPTFTRVENFIVRKCSGPTLLEQDRAIFHCCLELSWAQISMTNKETILNEPITAVIARLGIYRNYNENSPSFTLTIPRYLTRLYNWPYLSIMSIAELEDKGQRLESGFRRILHLRMSMRATNWSGIGLPILDSNVPFPEARLERSYVFPQISKKIERTEAEARQCMNEIHNQNTSSLSHTKYSPTCLPWLCEEMELGQYYQPLPKSSSADALIRCSNRDLVCFQFKNLQSPFPESSLDEEIVKCSVTGWNVFMVIVCTEGHSINEGEDYFATRAGVNVVLLSKDSVAKFFGAAGLKEFSSTSLYQDLSRRI
jgi:hypothetical protein